MDGLLPMFPLGTVMFPGVIAPLHVFEERYTALVEELMSRPDPADRLFGSVGIREGYEVGDHGAQSLFRIGCRLQLTEVTALGDGSFDIVAVGRDRIRLNRLETAGSFPSGDVDVLPDRHQDIDAETVEIAIATFAAYRVAVSQLREDPYPSELPRDPAYLSWVLAAATPLPLSDRQQLLETEDTAERLALVTHLLRQELRAMNVIPSLPATEVARTRWSPN